MKYSIGPIVMLFGLGLFACSESAPADGGSGGKVVQREEIPDSRFKPQSLENVVSDLIAGIESSNSADDLALGVVLKELQHFWRPVAVGANRAISELEVIGSVQGTTQRESLTTPQLVAEQINFVEEQRDLGVDGLAIAPHHEDLVPHMKEFTDAGVPVVTIDSDLPETGRDIYVGTDNTQGGVTGGETLVSILAGTTGRVLVLGNTDPSWSGGYDRTNAAAQVIEEAGNTVEILNSIWSPEEEVNQIVEALQDDSTGLPVVGLLGVFANAHTLATAAIEADMDEMPKIVAFDFEPDTLSYMQQGVISATHVQRQYYMGYMSVYLLYSINAVGLESTKAALGSHLLDGFHLDTGLDAIRSDDLEEYNSFIDDLGI